MNRISKSKGRLVRRLASRRVREREGLALVEGPGVILEALGSTVELRWVLVGEEFEVGERGREIVSRCGDRGVEVVRASDREVMALCATDAPRPALACAKPPPLEARSLERGRYLMALGVQMPGNLGTLVRSAWAFGLDGAVIGRGTVDPWNPKAVRASAGGVFHLPLVQAPDGLAGGRAGDAAGVERLNLLCADATGVPVDAVAEARLGDWVLVVGNEGSGVASRLRKRGRSVAVPLADGVDSLNVAMAGSILMYALTRAGAGHGSGPAASGTVPASATEGGG